MSLKVTSQLNNFSRGKCDHNLNGRNDLPIYQSSADIFRNFFSNFQGNGIYRTGMQMFEKFQDCRFVPFRFNNAQNYIAVFYNTKVRFLSYDSNNQLGWVQNSTPAILDVTTPYSLAQSKELDFTQNADVMYLTHNLFDPYKLVRASANSFTCTKPTITGTPFDNPTSGAVGMPAKCCFYKGRLYYAAPTKKVTNVYGSKGATYDTLTVGTGDDDGMAFTISDLTEPVSWLLGGNNSLIAGSAQAIVAINGGSTTAPITPSTVEASLTNTAGADATKPVRKDNLLFFIDNLRRRVYYFSYDLLQETFKADDANFIAYDITVNQISKLVFIKDRNDLIYTISDDGRLLSFNFNQNEKIIGWHEHVTDGLVKDMCAMSDNNGVISLFLLVKRGSDYFIEYISPEVEFPLPDTCFTNDADADRQAYWRLISEKLKGCVYLDNSVVFSDLHTSTLTFNGMNTITSDDDDFSSGDVGKHIVYKTVTGYEWGVFEITAYIDTKHVSVAIINTPTANTYSSWYLSADEITGLTDHASQTVSVVGDGGYIADFDVSAGGVLTLDRQVTVAVIGRKYEGLIKTFNLGFAVQGINTQVTPKNVVRAGVRTVFSAGGEIGTSLYSMEPVQEFDPNGYYGLPPLPMDGDKDVRYTDEYDKEKCLYIRQSLPLPFRITSVFIEAEYGAKQ